jgi:hypothetical protein
MGKTKEPVHIGVLSEGNIKMARNRGYQVRQCKRCVNDSQARRRALAALEEVPSDQG